LTTYQIAKSAEEAEQMCEAGLVRVNGRVVSNLLFYPQNGDIITTLNSDYRYQVIYQEEE
jgi:ribosomal protein S4E